LVITLIVNLKWKISAHMIGLGGVTGAITAISQKFSIDLLFVLLLLIFISGIVGWARLYLYAHKPSQVYTGFVVGFLCLFLLIIFI
jgi:membrane-associated phospholipid phosphatase